MRGSIAPQHRLLSGFRRSHAWHCDGDFWPVALQMEAGSAGGAATPGQTIELSFRFPERSERGHCTLSAHVVRTDDGGLGVDFDGVENDALTISELIACLQEQASTDLLAGRVRKQMH